MSQPQPNRGGQGGQGNQGFPGGPGSQNQNLVPFQSNLYNIL